MNNLIKGFDISPLKEIEELGGEYFDNGIKKDALTILKDNGMNLARIRLWNDPYDENKKSYGAGTCDINNLISLAKRLKELDIPYLLDFHYSDFWADPGKQFPPKKWMDKDIDELSNLVYEYTIDVLKKLKELNIEPKYIEVGNEISNGLLWPICKVPNFENIVKVINAGIKASKEIINDCLVMIHLDNGGDLKMCQNWFENYFKNDGADFDIIGLSYYPFWHGKLNDLKNNMDNLVNLYNKDIMVVEASYCFSIEDYSKYEKLDNPKGMATKASVLNDLEFEISPKGQKEFIIEVYNALKSLKDNRGLGVVYWGALAIPVPGFSWASEEGLKYIQDKGPTGNEWANQALFDYEGNILEALKVFKDIR